MIDQKENGKPTINLYAAVVGFTAPRLTKRGDWMMTAVLVDETCTTPRTAILFSTGPAKLPPLARMGDILRIHRAGVEVRTPMFGLRRSRVWPDETTLGAGVGLGVACPDGAK
jgi:hypothetical protein